MFGEEDDIRDRDDRRGELFDTVVDIVVKSVIGFEFGSVGCAATPEFELCSLVLSFFREESDEGSVRRCRLSDSLDLVEDEVDNLLSGVPDAVVVVDRVVVVFFVCDCDS